MQKSASTSTSPLNAVRPPLYYPLRCVKCDLELASRCPCVTVLFFACAKKSNQKKAHNLTKIDPDITYSLWGILIQYTLATPTKTFFTRLNCSSISELASSQYHSDTSGFSKHNAATTNKFSRLLFILEHVKTVPNGRLLLLSSACRSKGKKSRTTISLKGKIGRKA